MFAYQWDCVLGGLPTRGLIPGDRPVVTSSGGHCSGQYASYLNAVQFIFSVDDTLPKSFGREISLWFQRVHVHQVTPSVNLSWKYDTVQNISNRFQVPSEMRIIEDLLTHRSPVVVKRGRCVVRSVLLIGSPGCDVLSSDASAPVESSVSIQTA